MNDTQFKTLEQVRQCLEGTVSVELCFDAIAALASAVIKSPVVRRIPEA